MRRCTLILSAAVLCGAFVASDARADGWLPEWMGGKTTETTRVKKTSKPTHANGKTSGNALTNMFKPSKSKTVSKWPSQATSINRTKSKKKPPKDNDEGWSLGRLFKKEEPEKLKTTNDWMGLKQITP